MVRRITRDPRVMSSNRLKVASQFCIKRERNKDRIAFGIPDSPRTFVSWFFFHHHLRLEGGMLHDHSATYGADQAGNSALQL